MSNEKCCVEGCDRAGVVRANYPGSSVYCAEHGICGRCGESVECEELYEPLNVWVCPYRSRDLRPKDDPSEQSGMRSYWTRANASVSH